MIDLQEKWRGDAYYSDKTAFSNSMFSKLQDGFKEFHKWYTSEEPDPIDNKFSTGQYLHDYMARQVSRAYESECSFLFIPELNLRTKAGKEEYARLTDGVDLDRTYIVKDSVRINVEGLCNDFLASRAFNNLLSIADTIKVEKGYLSEKNELKLKGKLDFEATVKEKKFILDWKTSSFFDAFEEKAYKYGYNRQASMYSHISDATNFSFVVFDIVRFNRWKICRVDKDSLFFKSGTSMMDCSIEMAKAYLKHGVNFNSMLK